MVYSGLVALLHVITGRAPNATFDVFGLSTPFPYAIPPMLLVIGLFLTIFPLSERVQGLWENKAMLPVRVLLTALG